jgi:hypothetical protein
VTGRKPCGHTRRLTEKNRQQYTAALHTTHTNKLADHRAAGQAATLHNELTRIKPLNSSRVKRKNAQNPHKHWLFCNLGTSGKKMAQQTRRNMSKCAKA